VLRAVGGGDEEGVDRDHDEERAGAIGGGLDEGGEGGDAGLELVGGDVGEEAAHEARVVDLAYDVIVGAALGVLLGFFGLFCLRVFFVGHWFHFRGCWCWMCWWVEKTRKCLRN